MKMFSFLLAAIWPLAKKLLASLGIGWLTYEGLGLVGNQIQSAVLASWGQIGGVTLQILSLAGVPESVGILLGAISAKIALVAVGRLGKVTT